MVHIQYLEHLGTCFVLTTCGCRWMHLPNATPVYIPAGFSGLIGNSKQSGGAWCLSTTSHNRKYRNLFVSHTQTHSFWRQYIHIIQYILDMNIIQTTLHFWPSEHRFIILFGQLFPAGLACGWKNSVGTPRPLELWNQDHDEGHTSRKNGRKSMGNRCYFTVRNGVIYDF